MVVFAVDRCDLCTYIKIKLKKMENRMKNADKIKKAADLIQLFGIRPRKEYGQNFLVDEEIFEKIIGYGDITKEDLVIEIGPGIGTLTQRLCDNAGFVAGIEIDKDMKPVLDFVLSGKTNAKIIYADVKEISLKDDIVGKYMNEGISRIKIVANLPYYIATSIITDVLSTERDITKMVVMVQKEVAQRICAKPGGRDYGVLSVAVQLYADATIVMDVPADSFIPVPSVDSSVVVLEPDMSRYSFGDDKFFFKVIKAAFSQRRKTILNSIYAGFGKRIEKEELIRIFESVGIDPGDRAERISIDIFCDLAKKMMPLF